jgi:hypothetical protein
LAQVWPRPQREAFDGLAQSLRSRYPVGPRPGVMRVRISSNWVVPRRQGAHLPHDSDWVKLRKKRAISTMQLFSSITTMPPEPMMADPLEVS